MYIFFTFVSNVKCSAFSIFTYTFSELLFVKRIYFNPLIKKHILLKCISLGLRIGAVASPLLTNTNGFILLGHIKYRFYSFLCCQIAITNV